MGATPSYDQMEIGKYQAFSPGNSNSTYIMDTSSGQMWYKWKDSWISHMPAFLLSSLIYTE